MGVGDCCKTSIGVEKVSKDLHIGRDGADVIMRINLWDTTG